MPKMASKKYTKKTSPKKAKFLLSRSKFRPLRYTNKGFLNITRKTPPNGFLNDISAGQVSLSAVGMAPDWIQFGTSENIYGNVYNLPFSMTFRLSDLVASSDITNIADQFRINWVKVNMIFNSNVSDTNQAGAIPGVFYIVDNDDAAVQNVAGLRQKMGLRYKSWSSSKMSVSCKLQPKPAAILYKDVGTGYQIPMKRTWINSGSADTPHYCLKGYFTNLYLPSNTDKLNFTSMVFDITYGVSAKDFQ